LSSVRLRFIFSRKNASLLGAKFSTIFGSIITRGNIR
jgi:hypothetical protein